MSMKRDIAERNRSITNQHHRCLTCSSFHALVRAANGAPPAGECLDLESPLFNEVILASQSCEYWVPNEKAAPVEYREAMFRNELLVGAEEHGS